MKTIQQLPSIRVFIQLLFIALSALASYPEENERRACSSSTCEHEIPDSHPSDDKQDSISIPELASTRLIKKTRNCEKVIRFFKAASDSLPQRVEFFRPVLTAPGFRIICTTAHKMNKLNHGHPTSPSALFNAERQVMYLTPKELTIGLIFHEMIHASHYFRHYKIPFISIEHALFPLYPVNEKNVRRLTRALNRGDKRVNQFRSLYYREKNKERLTKQEIKHLRKFKNSFLKNTKNCLRPLIKDISSHGTYNSLLKHGYTPGQKGYTLTKGHDTMEIFHVKQTKKETITYMKPIGEILAFFESVRMAHLKLNTSYRMKHPLEKAIEREAYTFQHLSKHLIDAFYPEVQKLHEEDILYSQRMSGTPAGT